MPQLQTAKECRICWERKPLSKFHNTKDPVYADCHLNWCKECLAEYNRRKREAKRAKRLLLEGGSSAFIIEFE